MGLSDNERPRIQNPAPPEPRYTCMCPGCDSGFRGKPGEATKASEQRVEVNGVVSKRTVLYCEEHAPKDATTWNPPPEKSAEEVAGRWGAAPGMKGARG